MSKIGFIKYFIIVALVCPLIVVRSGFGASGSGDQLKEADKLFGLNKYDQAEQAYLGIVQEGGADTFIALRQLCCLYVTTTDQAKADAAYESLLTIFSDQPTLAKQISLVGDAYVKVGKFDKASSLYQYIVDHWPGSENLLWAKAGFAKIDIAKESDALAAQKIEAFVTDFNDHSDLAQAVFSVAEAYWYKASDKSKKGLREEQHKYLYKAMAQWERISKGGFRDSQDLMAKSCFYCGDCYRLMFEYQKAIEKYEEYVSRWPNNTMAASAQFLIGQNYKHLWLDDPKVNIEYRDKSRAAYQKLVDNYPDSKPAKMIAKSLKRKDS